LKINREHIVGLVCLAIAAAALAITPGFPEGQVGVNLTGPAFFPNVLAYLLIILGVLQGIAGFRLAASPAGAARTTRMDPAVLKRVLAFLALVFSFVFLFEPLGYFPTTFIFLFLLMMLFGVKPLKSALFSTLYVAVIYLLFGQLFTIGLPSGILAILGI